MLIVALTGGIATGKTEVGRLLAERGCYLHSADAAAHEVMTPGGPAWEKLAAHFGPSILNPDATVNRASLASIVFHDDGERRFLNAIVHPFVLEKMKEVVTRLEAEGGHRIFISEAALTIEAGYARFYDRVIVVFCRPEIQEARLVARDGIDLEDARLRIRSQMPVEEKKKFADYLIDTSGSLDETRRQTEDVYRGLVEDWRAKEARVGKSA